MRKKAAKKLMKSNMVMKARRRSSPKKAETFVKEGNNNSLGKVGRGPVAAKRFLSKEFMEAPDPIIIEDASGVVVDMNYEAERVYGWRREELVGKPIKTIMPPEYHSQTDEMLARVAHGKQVRNMEGVWRTKYGHIMPVLLTLFPIADGNRGKNAIVTISKDLSEIKKSEKALSESKSKQEMQARELKKVNEEIVALAEELKSKNEELERLDRLKSNFIATVSHELRTPLSIIKEGVSLVLDGIQGDINEKQRKVLTTARDNVDRLSRIIKGLLEMSLIEAGWVEISKQMVNLGDLVEKLVGTFKHMVEENGLEFRVTVPEKKLYLYIDSERIIQVFSNLIGNAMNYTKVGYIELSVEETDDKVVCKVTDTGTGISETDLPYLFDTYKQGGRVPGMRAKCSGLGLSIARGILELHKGEIWAESELGKGSKFVFTLPKYTSHDLFSENIFNAICAAKRSDSHMSLIKVIVANVDKLKNKLSEEEMYSIYHGMRDVLERKLRRTGDSILIGAEGIVAVLVDCDKYSSLIVLGRIKQLMEDYFTRENLLNTVELQFSCATYPDDGRNEDELFRRLKKEVSKLRD